MSSAAGRRRRRGALVTVAVLGTMTLSGCGRGASTNASGPESAFAPTYLALCRAAKAAHDGHATAAGTLYLDSAHLNLPELANKVLARDRHAAGQVLIAHAFTEADVRKKASASALEGHLSELAAAVRSAIRLTGARVPDTCEKELQ